MQLGCTSGNRAQDGHRYMVVRLDSTRSTDLIRELPRIPPAILLSPVSRRGLSRLLRREHPATVGRLYGLVRRTVCTHPHCRITRRHWVATWQFRRCPLPVLTGLVTPQSPASRILRRSSRRGKQVPLHRIQSLAAASISISVPRVMAGEGGRQANE